MGIGAFAHQSLPLGDPEFVLFVNDNQSELFRRESLFQQRVRADVHSRAPDARPAKGQRLLPGGRPRFRCPGPQFHRDSQRLKPPAEVAPMLFGQDFCRRHQRHVATAFQRHQRRAGRHDGFAGADVALEQAAHGRRPGQVAADFAQHPRLGLSQVEFQRGQERLHQPVVAGAGQGAGVGFQVPPARLHGLLQFDILVQRQPLAGDIRVVQFFWKMQQAHRLRSRGQGNGLPANRQIPARQGPVRARFGDGRLKLFQQPPDQ